MVIPAPVESGAGERREFALRPGTAVVYSAPGLAPIVERFCAEVERRTGLRVAPTAGGRDSDSPRSDSPRSGKRGPEGLRSDSPGSEGPGSGGPVVRIELVAGEELGVLPAPLGIS